LLITPWLCAYWPVRNVVRDGQQSEKLTKLLLKVVPWPPISELTLSITLIDSTVWSSVSITTTLGVAWAAGAARASEAITPSGRPMSRRLLQPWFTTSLSRAAGLAAGAIPAVSQLPK
jgi:hypothetical protein